MKTIRHTSTFFVLVAVLGVLLFLLDSTRILTLRFGNAQPLLLIPLLVATAMAAREWVGLVLGAVFGILMDTVGAETLSFNMIALLLIGCIGGLLCSYYVNDNIYSAVVLCFFANLFYFVARWFFYYVCTGRENPLSYLAYYCLPTIIYNTIFIIPFYYLIKYISKRTCYYN